MGELIDAGQAFKNRGSGLEDLRKDVHVQKLKKSIADRKVQMDAIMARLKTLNIVEEHVEFEGEPMILLSVKGMKEGLMLKKADLDSGQLTLQRGYMALAEMHEAQNSTTQ